MKVFRVVTERDGNTVKAPGVAETAILRVDRYFVAETMDEVWTEIALIRSDPEETLIAIIEEHPSVMVIGSEVRS